MMVGHFIRHSFPAFLLFEWKNSEHSEQKLRGMGPQVQESAKT